MAAEVIAAWIAAGSSMAASLIAWKSGRASERAAARSDQATAIIAAKTDIQTNDRTIYVEQVTSERGIWRADLRRETAKVVSWLYAPDDDVASLHAALSGIALRLNPKGRSDDPAERDHEPFDRDIYEVLADIRSSLASGSYDADLADRLERRVALLIKDQWEVSKDEARQTRLT